MLKITPFDFKSFNRNESSLRNVPVYNPKTDFSQNSNVALKSENPVKNKKKILPIILSLGTVMGMVLAFIKRKAILANIEGITIKSNAKQYVEESKNILERAQKEYASVYSVLQESKLNNFKDFSDKNSQIARKFIKKNDSDLLMLEISEKKILRETQFDPKTLDIKTILKGIVHKTPKMTYAKQSYAFNDKQFLSYSEDISGELYNPVKTYVRMKHHYDFENNNLLFYANNVVVNNEKLNYGERYIFVDDKLRKYENGVASSLNDSCAGMQISFSPKGFVEEYKTDIKMSYDPYLKELTENVGKRYV